MTENDISESLELRERIAKCLYEMLVAPHRNEDNWNETTWESLREADKDFYRKYKADAILQLIQPLLDAKDKEIRGLREKYKKMVVDRFDAGWKAHSKSVNQWRKPHITMP